MYLVEITSLNYSEYYIQEKEGIFAEQSSAWKGL